MALGRSIGLMTDGSSQTSMGSPLLLGSIWTLLPALAAGALMIAWTWFEDRMLMAGLPGYLGYTRQVRHRLGPGT